MQPRMLCLYFPGLAVDRLEREKPERRGTPFAVTQELNGHSYIAAVNLPARQACIQPGMRLADARTLLPGLDAIPDDPEANRGVKRRFVEWCNRYSPLVADDNSGGIVLNIAGCAHLFIERKVERKAVRGETALLQDIQARIRRSGYRVRGAIAGTLGAAWALARYGKKAIVSREETTAALNPLPVEALRLPGEITSELRRVGITNIALLRRIPRQSLAVRYGPGILLRLDQASGNAEEPIVPYRPPAPHRAIRTLAEPVATLGSVQYVLLNLLKEICSRLEKEHTGARRLNLDCYRVDGTVTSCRIGTSRPVRSITHLMRLFQEKLSGLDAGFGIETLVLSVPSLDELDSGQLNLPEFDVDREDTELDGFVDRLGMRLGFDKVCRFRIHENFLPERAVEFRTVTAEERPSAAWPAYRIRPVCFIDPPVRIEVPGAPLSEFRLGGERHRIVRAEGPERLTAGWWRDNSPSWKFRDYYRVEDDRGARFWIFRESDPARWYLRGHLP